MERDYSNQSTSTYTHSTSFTQSTSTAPSSPFQINAVIDIAMKENIFPPTEEKAEHILRNFDTNAKLIRHFYLVMKKNKMLPATLEKYNKKDSKSAKDAEVKGNKESKMDYIGALKFYNESLCWAEEGSIAMGRVYLSRSSIYAKTGFYKFALDNIEKAFNTKFPHIRDLKKKKKEIEEMQQKAMQDSLEEYGSIEEITLSHQSHPKISFISENLQRAHDQVYGRHILTTSDVKPGEILALEEPFITAPYKKFEYSTCYNCTSHNFYNLIPCSISTKAMFCSDTCMEESKPILPIIDVLQFWVDNTFGLRATLKAFNLFHDRTELQKLLAQGTDMNPFECDLDNADERTKFLLFNSMLTNQEQRSKLETLKIVYNCASIFHMVKEFTVFKNILEDKNTENIFLELLMRFHQIGLVNNFDALEPFKRKKKGSIAYYTRKGMAQANYLVSSLFAHSCAPNVVGLSVSQHGKLAIVALHPIKAGEPLFISYGHSFATAGKTKRQVELKSKYQFLCNCIACADIEKFTTALDGIVRLPEDEGHRICKINAEICMFDEKSQEYARQVRETVSKKITELFHEYPTASIYAFEGILIDAIHIMAFKKPMDVIFALQKSEKKKCTLM